MNIVFEFETESIYVEVKTNKSREEVEEELFDDAMSYAMNMADWQPRELVEDVMKESGYNYRILQTINIRIA